MQRCLGLLIRGSAAGGGDSDAGGDGDSAGGGRAGGVVMLEVAGVVSDAGGDGNGASGSAAGGGCKASSTAGGVCMKRRELEDLFPLHFLS